MISSILSRTSAALLLVAGVAMLFASDVLLPSLVPAFPASATWFGQLLGAAWIGVAALNWLQRGALLGGIYGRPVVLANFALFMVTALSLVRPLLRGAAPAIWWGVCIVTALMATAYGLLLLRGPLDSLQSTPS